MAPLPKFPKNCCGNCWGNCRRNSECWGECRGNCCGDCPCLEEQRSGSLCSSSPSTPPSTPSFPGSFPSSFRNSFGKFGLRGPVDGRGNSKSRTTKDSQGMRLLKIDLSECIFRSSPREWSHAVFLMWLKWRPLTSGAQEINQTSIPKG